MAEHGTRLDHESPKRILVLEYLQAGGDAAIAIMANLYQQGWETLEELAYYECCGIYRTVLYKPDNL